MGSAGLWSEFEVVSGGEWSVPHVVTQVPSGDVMHLLPLWGSLASFSSFLELWDSEDRWVGTALASWELLGSGLW